MHHKKPPIVFFMDGHEYNVLDGQGGYVRSFIDRTNLNVLINSQWTCFGRPLLDNSAYYNQGCNDENLLTKIRLGEDLGIVWKSKMLSKYMKKYTIEQILGIQLTVEERTDFRLLKGFYLYGYAVFGGIFDTAQVIWRHREQLRTTHPRLWKKIESDLETCTVNADESNAKWLHERLYYR